MLIIKIGVMPGKIAEYTFGGAVSVEEALKVAEADFASAQGNAITDYLSGVGSYQAKLDGEVVEKTSTIHEGSSALVLAKLVKGAR